MSIRQILSQIQELTPFSVEDVEGGNPATLKARQGRKRSAIDQLEVLRADYALQLLEKAAYIIVNGDSRDEFVAIATTETGNCFSADPESVYVELASRVPSELYVNKANCSDAFDVLGRHLEDLAIELGIRSYPQLLWKQSYSRAISSPNEFLDLVKLAVNEQVGSELVGIYTVKRLVDRAIEKGHSADITPILLPTNDESLIQDLLSNLTRLSHRVYAVTAGKSKKKLPGAMLVKNINEDSVQQTLIQIRDSKP